MKLTDELFKNYKLIEKTLIPYGFFEIDNKYFLNKKMHNNLFELRIIIDSNTISSNLFDLTFNDIYSQIDILNSPSSFISTLKEECKEILLDIRDKCFHREAYISGQAILISSLIKEKYNVDPEFLFSSDPCLGVYRNKRTNKWFSLIMNIDRSKLDSSLSGEIEVLNLKLGLESDKYHNINGIYKAYHMNKKYWVSIILDNTIDTNYIMNLIDISFNLSDKKSKNKRE